MAGLPVPRKDHALVMARFAGEILKEMSKLVKSLEVSLGPDTADLTVRIGMHSGPVTGGVLRGARARFQLFGDVSFALVLLLLSIVFFVLSFAATADNFVY